MLKWFSLFYLILNFTEKSHAAAKLAEGTGLGINYYFRLLLSLGFVLGIIYVIGHVFRFKLYQKDSIKILKVIDKLYLEQGVSLYLVKAWDDTWIIGVGNKNIKLIKNVGRTNLNLEKIIESDDFVYKNFAGRVKNDLGKRWQSLKTIITRFK